LFSNPKVSIRQDTRKCRLVMLSMQNDYRSPPATELAGRP